MIEFYTNYAYYFLWILFLLIIFLFYLNFKRIIFHFKKIDKKTWVLLFLILILGTITRTIIFPAQHLTYIDEQWYMETAKNMLLSHKVEICENKIDKYDCFTYPKSVAWPFLISIFFKIFGINNYIALHLATVIRISSIFLMFFLGYLLFKNKEIGLWSALILAVTPFPLDWASAESNVISSFFVILSLITLLLYLKEKKLGFFLLALLTVIFTIQIRIENGVLVPFSVFFLGLNKGLRNSFKFWVAWPLPSIFFLFYAVQAFLLKESNYEIYQGPFFTFSNIIKNLIPAVNILTNQNTIFFFVILAFIGLCFWKKRKIAFALLVFFLFFFLVYVSFERMQPRFFLTPYLALILFISFGLFKINEFLKYKLLKGFSLIVIFVILFLIFYPSIINAKVAFEENEYDKATFLETMIPELIKNETGCYIATAWPIILTSTTDLKVISIDTYLEHLNEISGCVLFFKDFFCSDINDWDGSKKKCIEIEKYVNGTYRTFSYKDVEYSLYFLKGKK